ncbi:hypothetical protein [Bdellovibrio svalbardensis]|nr:hypothetical protein [Bdellovibrio svalbardensis]
MKEQGQGRKIIGNSRGIISVDFIFALTLCAGLCIVLFSLTFTLAMAEVGQYITFSTARAASAAHENPEKQALVGKDKFNELINRPVLKDLFAKPDGSWFLLGTTQPGSAPKADIRGGFEGSDFSNEYSSVNSEEIPLTGARIVFVPRLLNIKIAFLGSTSSDSDTGFSANLTAFMIREPTQAECWAQIKQRNDAILSLSNTTYKAMGGATSSKYIPMEDNGC